MPLQVHSYLLNAYFNKIKSDYSSDFPKLIDRTRYTRRKRPLFPAMEIIRQTLATQFLEFEAYFIVDSMPLEVCKLSREKRSKSCRQTFENAPDIRILRFTKDLFLRI